MNKSNRDNDKEVATALGRWGGKVCGSQPYPITIFGEKPLDGSGMTKGSPTCCKP